jgi:predicted metal-dependent phosphotriesterase family hydrolase
MSFVRTLLGDIAPAELGVTYAHEHLVIDGGVPVLLHPEYDLSDVERIVGEYAQAREAGLRSAVDAMPCDAGRNVSKLVEVSRRAEINVVAPTGLHLAKYYGERHWSLAASVDELAQLFVADIEQGIDENDYGGPLVRRTEHRAGVIKVAGSRDALTELEQRVFTAAAAAHRATGCPILTHCQDGTAALLQIEFLCRHGVAPAHITLSHVDKIVEPDLHREILSTGAFLEYDQAFRWKERPNGTLSLLLAMFEAGLGGQLMLGTDAAKFEYWHSFGGQPGLAWLLTNFSALMARHGLGEAEQRQIFVTNPARAYAFAPLTAATSRAPCPQGTSKPVGTFR